MSRISPSVSRNKVVRVAEQTTRPVAENAVLGCRPTRSTYATELPYLTHQTYLAYPTYFDVITKCPRRFCDQHPSFSSLQNGCSLPLLMTTMRVLGTPRLTR